MADNDEGPRDRSFGPAVQAAVDRAAAARLVTNASTDPNWRPDLWPKEPPQELDTRPWASFFASGSCAQHIDGSGVVHFITTIDPPTADPLSPFQRAELERILLDMDVARERLRKLLERS